MEQEFESLEEKAQEQLEEKNVADMIINNKISIDEYVGTTPKIPTTQYHKDLTSIEERTKEFNKKFYGEEEKIEKEFSPGFIPKFKEKMKIYLFGEIKDKIVEERKKGLEEEGLEIYEEAMGTLKDIKKKFPEIKKGIHIQEDYQNKLDGYIKKHSEIYFTCEIKNKKIKEVIEGMEKIANDENESTERIKKARDSLKQLYNQQTKVLQTINNITQTTNIYNENLEYVQKDVATSKEIYSNLETKIKGFEANIDLFKSTIETVPVAINLYEIGTAIDNISDNLRENLGEVHKVKMANLELNRERIEERRDLGMYNKDQITEIETEGERFSVVKRANEQEILNKARAVFYSKQWKENRKTGN